MTYVVLNIFKWKQQQLSAIKYHNRKVLLAMRAEYDPQFCVCGADMNIERQRAGPNSHRLDLTSAGVTSLNLTVWPRPFLPPSA